MSKPRVVRPVEVSELGLVGGKRPKRARIPVDWEEVREWFMAQAKVTEVARAIGMTTEGLRQRCKRDLNIELTDLRGASADRGKVEIRLAQFRNAKESVAGAIWFGKQYLDQGEPGTKGAESQSRVVIEFEPLTDEECAQIAAGCRHDGRTPTRPNGHAISDA